MVFYNLHFEYFVLNPWMEKFSQLFSSENVTPNVPDSPSDQERLEFLGGVLDPSLEQGSFENYQDRSMAFEQLHKMKLRRARQNPTRPPSQFNVSLSECTVGLNPLNLPSRGLLLITSTTIRGEWDFQNGGRGKFDLSINKAHLFCIDVADNLVPQLRQKRLRSTGRREILSYFTVLPIQEHVFTLGPWLRAMCYNAYRKRHSPVYTS
jgi:hypothetical protein